MHTLLSLFATLLCGIVALPVLAAEPVLAAVAPTPRWPFVDAAPSTPKPAQGGVGLVLESRDGALVAGQVTPGGPAAKAGVEAGDELMTLDGWAVPANSKVPDVVGHAVDRAVSKWTRTWTAHTGV